MKNTGTLRIQTFAARQSAPMEGVTVAVQGDGFTLHCITDATGSAADIPVEAPACTLSLDEDNTIRPYAVVSLTAAKSGYRTVRIEGIQIFAGQITLAQPAMIPVTEEGKDIPDAPIVIPPHPLFAGSGGSGAQPVENCTPRVLDKVIIPKNITVHLGKPAASARNVTVSFRDYIANVASSEVYPTWPEQALRANIHCQISLALNRIYTEWYPSKGYTFNITNSTSYDQYYVHGRTVFDVMVRITDDIFNTYLRKTRHREPLLLRILRRQVGHLPGAQAVGHGDAGQQRAQRFTDPAATTTAAISRSCVPATSSPSPRATPVRPSGRETAARQCSPCSGS